MVLMMGMRKKGLVLGILCALAFVSLPVMAADLRVGPALSGGQFDSLDNALAVASNYDNIVLVGDVNSTLTHGNTTGISKSVTFTSQGYSVFLNNTLFFNGTGTTVTFADAPKFIRATAGDTLFSNNSLVQLTDSTTLSGSSGTLTAGAAVTAINISGNGNAISNAWTITGTGGGTNSMAVNVSGSGNTVTLTSGSITSEGKGINLVGNNNQITVASSLITAPSGKIYLWSGASGNTITDSSFSSNRPRVYIYNGTSAKTTYAWYFYNDSWSPSGKNRNMTIDVSYAIPLAGNVGIAANLYNVSGVANDIHRNTTLSLSNGYTGGILTNYTKDTIFYKFPAEVPVNLSFGENTFGNSYHELNIGTVVVLNFNPVNSITSENFNVTQTTNWSTIPDFTAAPDLRFVIDDGTAAHNLRGNLSFTENLDLTDQTTGTALQTLGNNLQIATAGNSIDLNVAAAGMSAFNKKATLTVYPTGFSFSSGSDIKITATTDSGTSTVLYNNGVWLDKAGFVASGDDVTVGPGYIILPVQHFSKYNFNEKSSSSSTTTSSSDSGPAGSGSSYDPPSATSGGKTAETVNVGGGSIITRADVAGSDLGKTLVITARPVDSLPTSLAGAPAKVYQYLSITTSTIPGTLNQATLSFSIPKSWLTANGFTKSDIVMMHYVNGQWQVLETRFISENGNSVNYEAITPSFSYFAVAYKQGGTNMSAFTPTVTTTVAAADKSLPVTTTGIQAASQASQIPVATTKTPVASPPQAAPPVEGSPVSVIVASIISIAIGAFLIRRWWIHRQNPTLFKNLE